MPNDCISYRDSGYFTPLVLDYLEQRAALQPLYGRFPTIENFEAQIAEKQHNFKGSRDLLSSVLESQYANLSISAGTKANIQSLKHSDTFTVTTGHQLNIFTGPLYFLYKIISAINLSKELRSKYPRYNFVPVYWMATEDHDFEEINYFNFKGKKFRWNRESAGAVGRLSTDGLEEFYNVFSEELGLGDNADSLRQLFKDAYLSNGNLAAATRHLANAIFGEHGVVIIDGDDKALKKQFVPFMRDELLNQTANDCVNDTVQSLKEYTIQVNPREINLFFLDEKLRERILLNDGKYVVNNTSMVFSKDELLQLLEAHPEKFSPNVVMRPLYQEVILPNLCYIGGGGELAYWLELKAYFEKMDVAFPMLLLRNSALLATVKQQSKSEKLGLTWPDLFLKPNVLADKKVRELSEMSMDFSSQKEFLRQQFDMLNNMASKTHVSFLGAVKAQEAKQIKGLEKLEKRLLKAEKKQHAESLERIKALQDELFPNNSLQERFSNFATFYLESGPALIPTLISALDPLESCFKIVVL